MEKIIGKITAGEVKIKRAMEKVVDGEYTVPRFQRDFVWDSKKIAGLMDSIGNGFPLGVILLAETKDSPLSGRNEVFQFLSGGKTQGDGKIVIDGQQRLTSISIVYHATDLIKYFKGNKRTPKAITDVVTKVCANLCFFEDKFYDRKDLVELFEDQGESENAAELKADNFLVSLEEINTKVKMKIGEKTLFTHTLYDWTDSEIIEIFTSMNKSSKPLTHIDLMNGSMFNASSNDFDLLGRIDSFNKELNNWGKMSKELYAQCLKIFYDLKVYTSVYKQVNYKADVLVKWSAQEDKVNPVIRRIDDFEELLKNTCSLLGRKFELSSLEALPKEVYLLTTFALMCVLNEREKDFDIVLKKLISRITVRLINNDYASSPNAKALEDINTFLLPLLGLSEENFVERKFEATQVKEKLYGHIMNLTYKTKTNAFFKLYFASLASKRPMNLFGPGVVPLVPSGVTKIDKNIHHWVPKESITNKMYRFSNIDLIGNLTLITEDENKNDIRAKTLDVYLRESKEYHGENFERAINSHGFDLDDINEFLNALEGGAPITVQGSFDKMIKNRIKNISDEIFDKFILVDQEN